MFLSMYNRLDLKKKTQPRFLLRDGRLNLFVLGVAICCDRSSAEILYTNNPSHNIKCNDQVVENSGRTS